MRYGLADVRNYDSIELARSLDWFAPLYAPDARGQHEPARRSPGTECSAAASGSAKPRCAPSWRPTPPPAGAFARVDRVGAVWIARLDGRAAGIGRGAGRRLWRSFDDPGLIRIRIDGAADDRIVVRETFDPGWRAEVDGAAAAVEPHRGAFLAVPVPAGRHRAGPAL